jgi:membrane protein YqaA with SNARE-associated domain
MGYPPMGLFFVATLGNTLGAVVNYGAGCLGEHTISRRYKPSDLPTLNNARKIIQRWGAPAMILAWAPVIGDPLTVLAGLAGMPFWRFFFWMGLGKALRYAILLAAADQTRLFLS